MTCDRPRDAWANQPTLQDLKRSDIWQLRRGFLERLWPNVEGWRVAEVGSGPAHDSLTFAERGADVTAIDLSPTGVAMARQFYRDENLPLRAVCASAMDLPFDDGSFDLAFNAGVLEHFTDEQLERVIDEMIRVVRPGGYVLAFCPNRYNFFYQTHLRRIAHHSYDFERAFTASEMAERMSARGLTNIRRSGVHLHPAPNYLLPAWLPKHHRIEPWCRWLCTPVERAMACHHARSLVAQDFVLWAEVPARLGARRSIVDPMGGPAVRDSRRAA